MIKINIENTQEINTYLKDVNGRASMWVIASATHIRIITETIEAKLLKDGIAKSNWTGITVKYSPSCHAANAYKNSAITNTITLQRGSKNWYLTNATKWTTFPCRARHEEQTITLTEKSEQALLRKAYAGYAPPTAQQTTPANYMGIMNPHTYV